MMFATRRAVLGVVGRACGAGVGVLWGVTAWSSSEEEGGGANGRLIFMGTGCSTGTPRPLCLTNPEHPRCEASRAALLLPPHLSKGYRNNPSLLVQTPTGEHVQIDAGKTFREAVIRWYPVHHVTSLDGIILSHDHADAMLGLDDVRGFQTLGSPALPVFLSARTLASVERVFPYLMPSWGATQSVQRSVASIEFNIIEAFKPFTVCGLQFLPLPVMHGEDYESFGFEFGTHQRIVYISDVSRIPPKTDAHLRSKPIDLLVLDGLFYDRHHNTHFSVLQALDVVRDLRPRRALLVGVSGEFTHEELSARVGAISDAEGLNVAVAHDGLCVPVRL